MPTPEEIAALAVAARQQNTTTWGFQDLPILSMVLGEEIGEVNRAMIGFQLDPRFEPHPAPADELAQTVVDECVDAIAVLLEIAEVARMKVAGK